MRKLFFILLAAGAAFVLTHPAFANPFMSGRPSEVNAGFMDAFATPFLQQIIETQRVIHEAITARIEALKEGQSLAALWSLLLISFGYGVFHVLAPGHGKVIVGSYFLGNNASWRDGVWAGLLMAIGHTITAVGIVAVLYLVFGLGQFAVLNDAQYMELAGYGLIAAIGIWLLVRALRDSPECNVCGHDHHHHGHKHDHDHAHHHHDHDFVEKLTPRPSTGLFAAASLVPCTGSMIILLFCLANNVLWAGILAVIAIALGMWLTITAIGLFSMLLRRAVVGDGEHVGPSRRKLTKALRCLAALVVIMTGSLLFTGTVYSMMQ
jgi:ABC-type nickel/cobalt efflux system permease component RcnA